MTQEASSAAQGQYPPDFAESAAGLSRALKRIADGYAGLGDDHFQEVARKALSEWGYFPPKPPPDYMARDAQRRLDTADAMAKIMALMQGQAADAIADRDRYRERAFLAESKVQELVKERAEQEVKDAD